MTEPLSSNTQERMRALCKKISVAHDLDPEIQDELYGHMEDKLLAYLNGEEPVTEDDALILVREHFGDPAVLKGLLQDVHTQEVHVTFARRLVGVVVAGMATGVVTSVLYSLETIILVFWAAWIGSDRNLHFVRNGVAGSLSFGAVVLVWAVLRVWQRRIDEGKRLWFMKWRPLPIAGLIFVLFIFARLIPEVMYAPGVLSNGTETHLALPASWGLLATAVTILCWFAVPLMWLWWFDRPPRRPRTCAYALLAWSVHRLLVSFLGFHRYMPRFSFYFGYHDPGRVGYSSRLARLAYGQLPDSELFWNLSFGPRGVATGYSWLVYGIDRLLQMALLTLFIGAVAALVYASAQYIRRRYALRVQEEVANG